MNDAEELRRFFSNVFFLMGAGVLLTGIITWVISHDPATMAALFNVREVVENGETKSQFGASGWWMAAAILELGLVFVLAWYGLTRLSVGFCLLLFTVYAALNGVTLAPVIYAYTDASVAKVFFISAATFGAAGAWGHFTKRNLLPLGSFFLVGLIGLLIALVVNIFFSSPLIDFTISSVAVLLFAGLTAYDMQKLREMFYNFDKTPNLVVYGALTLYLDFINILIHMLRLFGTRK